MGRRGHIFLYGFLSLMWSFNTYTNWRLYSLGGPSTLATMHVINMIATPMLVLFSLGQVWKLLTSPKPERILDPHVTIMIEESLVVRVFRWLALAVFTGSGIWGVVSGTRDNGFLAISVIILGIGVYGLAALTFNPRQRLTLTPQSLTDSRLRPGTIAWEELAEVQTKNVLGNIVLTLVLRDTREFRPASLLARWRRVDKLKVNPIAFGVDPDVLRRGIEVRRNVFTF